MGIEKRRYIRFSLDIPALLHKQNGVTAKTTIQQISIGGCLTDWDSEIETGDDCRLELFLPTRNRLPLSCKVTYIFDGKGLGIKFIDISQFEQELLAQVISESLEKEGLPLLVDPFTQPPMFISQQDLDRENNERVQAAADDSLAIRK